MAKNNQSSNSNQNANNTRQNGAGKQTAGQMVSHLHELLNTL